MAVMHQTDLLCEVREWDGRLTDDLRSGWESLRGADPHGTIFHSPAWMVYAIQARVARPTRLLIITRANQALAMIPLQQRTPWTWELPVPVSVEYPPLLISTLHEDAVWRSVAAWLRQQTAIKRLSFGCCGDERRLMAFEMACRAEGGVARRGCGPSVVTIPLADTWDKFLSGLGKSTRSKLRRGDTHFRSSCDGFAIDFLTGPKDCAEALSELIRLYRARWDQQIGGCVFSRAMHPLFYRRFVEWAVERGHVMMPVMRKHDCRLAIGLIFHVPGQQTAWFHFIARDPHALPNHWLNAPGIFLVGQVVRWAIERGFTALCMGAGSNQYKMTLGGQEVQTYEMLASRSPLADGLTSHLDRGLHVIRRLPAHLSYHTERLVRQHQSSPCAKLAESHKESKADTSSTDECD